MGLENNVIWKERNNKATGKKFEDEIAWYLRKGLGQSGKNLKRASEKDDKENGTDYVYLTKDKVIPIDLTMDFTNKDNMYIIYNTGLNMSHGTYLNIGIRTGNSHKGGTAFENPVIVVGLDILPYQYKQGDTDLDIGSRVQKLAGRIIQLAEQAYDAAMTGRSDIEFKINGHYPIPDSVREQFKNIITA